MALSFGDFLYTIQTLPDYAPITNVAVPLQYNVSGNVAPQDWSFWHFEDTPRQDEFLIHSAADSSLCLAAQTTGYALESCSVGDRIKWQIGRDHENQRLFSAVASRQDRQAGSENELLSRDIWMIQAIGRTRLQPRALPIVLPEVELAKHNLYKPDFDWNPHVDFSIINESIHKIIPSGFDYLLPPHMDIKCLNCSLSTNIDAQANHTHSLEDFFSDGYIRVSTGISLNLTLEVDLQSGFKAINTFIPLYSAPIQTIPVNDSISFALSLDIGIPLVLAINSPLTFIGGFSLNIPKDAHIDIFGSSPNSTHDGYANTTFDITPFTYNAPGMTISAYTGLEMKLVLTASTPENSVADARGSFLVDLNLPRFNLTVEPMQNVTSSCLPPVNMSIISNNTTSPSSPNGGNETIYKQAAKLTPTIQADLAASGTIFLSLVNEINMTWTAPVFPPLDKALPLAPVQCLYGERLEIEKPSDSDGKNETKGGGDGLGKPKDGGTGDKDTTKGSRGVLGREIDMWMLLLAGLVSGGFCLL